MKIEVHQFSSELENAIVKLKKFAIDFTCANAIPVIDMVDKQVCVVFDDVNAPSCPSTIGKIHSILRRLLAKYNEPKNESEQRFAKDLKRLSDYLGEDGENPNLCGEGIFFPWFNEDRFKDAETSRDAETIRKAILSAHVGGVTRGIYSHDTKTITLFTRNIGNEAIDFISTFSHEYFHAIHYFLIDLRHNTEHLSRYYHTVVLESLASWFQIEFLKTLGPEGIKKAEEIQETINKYSPIFYPYSGAKYFNSGWCNVSFCEILEKSLKSFEDSLRALILDNYEVEIILQKEPYPQYDVIVRIGKPYGDEVDISSIGIGPIIGTRNNRRVVHLPGFAPTAVCDGIPIYLIPQNENMFRGMFESGNSFGILLIYRDGTSRFWGSFSKFPLHRYEINSDDILNELVNLVKNHPNRLERFYRQGNHYLDDLAAIMAYIIW